MCIRRSRAHHVFARLVGGVDALVGEPLDQSGQRVHPSAEAFLDALDHQVADVLAAQRFGACHVADYLAVAAVESKRDMDA